MGSYICLPVITQIASIAELDMSGGDTVSLTLQFAPGTEFLGFDKAIDDRYYFNLYYGPLYWGFHNLTWEFNASSAELFVNCTTSEGILTFHPCSVRFVSL